MKKYAFIDGENVPHLLLENLNNFKNYNRLFYFLGKNQTIPANIFLEITCFRCSENGEEHKNNLDYHLIFTLGKLDNELDKNIAFHIFSKDKGFDSICTFIQANGRVCERKDTLDK